MKNFKSLILVFVVLFTGFQSYAHTSESINPNGIHEQLAKMIRSSKTLKSIDQDTKVMVKFMVTRDHEIVVLSTDNQALDQTFKSILNYKKLNVSSEMNNQVFTLPVLLKKN